MTATKRPRKNRLRIITVLVAVIAVAAAVTAYVIWSIPNHRTAFLIDASAYTPSNTEADSGFHAIADAVSSAAQNAADNEALSLRRFGGTCGDPQNTTQVVDSGTNQARHIADAAPHLTPSGEATLLSGILAAIDDFSGYYPFRGRKSNRVIVISSHGTDACTHDQTTLEKAIRERIDAAGLQLDFRFIGYKIPADQQDPLTQIAAASGAPKPTFTQTAAELTTATFKQLTIPESSEASRIKTPEFSTSPAAEGVSEVDIAFVVDTTSSMLDDIEAAQAAIGRITDSVFSSGRSTRVALVEYRDVDLPIPDGFPEDSRGSADSEYQARVDVSFTNDRTAFIGAVNKLRVAGGGDEPESVYAGIMAALELKWRPGAAKLVIPMGDAPAKDPEPSTGYTAAQVLRTAEAGGQCIIGALPQPCKYPAPVVINPIVIGQDQHARTSFAELATGSQGEVVTADSAEDIVAAIDDAVNKGVARAVKAAPQPPQEAPKQESPNTSIWGRVSLGTKIAVFALLGIGILVGLWLVARSRRRTSP